MIPFCSSCALHVINAAKSLLSGQDNATEQYETIPNPKEQRLKVIREIILSTTSEGRNLIRKSKNCNSSLEKMLKKFHDDLDFKKKDTDSKILKVSINIIYHFRLHIPASITYFLNKRY